MIADNAQQEFQAVDNAGLLSAWAPATPVTANTVCIR